MPLTTTPSCPVSSRWATSLRRPARSRLPSSCIGVTMAVRRGRTATRCAGPAVMAANLSPVRGAARPGRRVPTRRRECRSATRSGVRVALRHHLHRASTGSVTAVSAAARDVGHIPAGRSPRCSVRPVRQYLDLLDHVLDHGVDKSDRTGTGTSASSATRCGSTWPTGFPALTTKKLHLQVDHRRAAVVPARRHQRALAAGARHHDLGRVGRRRRRPRAGLRLPVAVLADARRRAHRPDRPGRRVDPHQPRLAAGTSSGPGTSPTSTRWRCRPATRCSSSTSPGRPSSPASSTSARPTSSSACRSTSPPTRC